MTNDLQETSRGVNSMSIRIGSMIPLLVVVLGLLLVSASLIIQTVNAAKPAPDSKIIFHNHDNTNEGNGNDKENVHAQIISPHASNPDERRIRID